MYNGCTGGTSRGAILAPDTKNTAILAVEYSSQSLQSRSGLTTPGGGVGMGLCVNSLHVISLGSRLAVLGPRTPATEWDPTISTHTAESYIYLVCNYRKHSKRIANFHVSLFSNFAFFVDFHSSLLSGYQ